MITTFFTKTTLTFRNVWCVVVLCFRNLFLEQLCIANISTSKTAMTKCFTDLKEKNLKCSSIVFCVSNFTKNELFHVYFSMLLTKFEVYIFPEQDSMAASINITAILHF